MRYILDNQGYIQYVSLDAEITCQNNKACTLYTGSVPANYKTLEEWFDNAIINAYKIIDGNLVLDELREKKIKEICAKEEEENSYTTKKYVDDKTNTTNAYIADELSEEISGKDLIVVDNTKEYNLPKVEVDNAEEKTVVVSNKNLLDNEILGGNNRGIKITNNEDKTILLDGKIDDYSTNLNDGVEETTSLKADIEVEGKAEQRQLEGYNIFSVNMIAVPTTIPGQADISFLKFSLDYKNNGITMKVIKANPRKYSGFYYGLTNAKMNVKYTATFKYKANMNGHSVYLVKDSKQFNPTTEWQDGKVTWTRTAQWNPFIFYTASENMPVDYTVEVKEIMITEGEEVKPYEPYCGATYINDNLVLGQSPSLDYPQEIKTVDKIGVSISSLNLFDGVPIVDVKPSYFQHCDYETIYDEELKRNVLHITCGKENQIYPSINYNFSKRLEKGKYYCLKFKYKFIMHNTVNDPAREKLWFFPNERNNNWDNYALALSKNATTSATEKWTDRIIKFEVDNTSYDKNEYSYSKMLLSLGYGKYAQGAGGVDITWLKKEVFISDLMLYEISENDYNDTNYTSLDYKQYFLPITKENILPLSETATSLPNGIKDEIRENKFIKRIIKRELNGTEYWNPIWNNLTNTMGFIIWSLNVKGWNVADVNEKENCLHCNSIKTVARSSGIAEKDEEAICLGGVPVYLALRINKNRLATQDVAGLKKYLADRKAQGNPVVIYYELKTPVETDLDIIKVPSADAKIEITTNIPTTTSSRVMNHIEKLEVPLKADMQNKQMIYLLKSNTDYYLSGLNNVTLNMYSYNGIDRELVYSGTGGLINLQADKIITQTSLTFNKTDKFTNLLLKPQLEISSAASEYLTHKDITKTSTQKVFENVFKSYEPKTVIMNSVKSNMKIKYFLYQTIKNTLANFKVEQDKIISSVKEKIDFTRRLTGKDLEIANALDTTIEELRIVKNANTELLLPSTKLYPAQNLFPCKNTDTFTVCIDTAPRGKPTSNIKKYTIATKQYMYVKDNIKDEVLIKTNNERTLCIIELVQKLQNVNGVISVLQEPIIKKLVELPIKCLKGTNYLYIENTSNYNLDLTYVYNVELNKLFTNKTETETKIEQTKDAIKLEVSKKVGKDEIKSAINQSAEAIKIHAKNIEFEGTVTANENFKILEDGSIEAKNGSFSGNINLADGSEILGGRGLLTNLQFFGKGDSYNSDVDGFAYVGFQTQEMESKNVKTGLAFNFYIPENFTIEKATMHLTYVPLKVNNTDLGSIKNVKLYKQTVDSNSYFSVYLNSSIINNISSYSEDTKLLSGDFNKQGENTFEITQGVNYGVNRLVIQSGNEPPAFNEMDWDGNHRNTAINSGYLSGEIYIIGYLNNSKKQGGETYYEKNNI